jgi:hypothetical protein
MSIGKLAVLAIALVFVSGGLGAALADWNNPDPVPAMDLVDVDARKDDGTEELLLAEEEDDEDLGNAGAGGAQNVAPLPVPAIAGDGDATVGDDGTAGGVNTQASPVPAPPLVAGGAGGGTPGDAAGAGGAGAGAGAAGGAADSDDGGAAGGDTDD